MFHTFFLYCQIKPVQGEAESKEKEINWNVWYRGVVVQHETFLNNLELVFSLF